MSPSHHGTVVLHPPGDECQFPVQHSIPPRSPQIDGWIPVQRDPQEAMYTQRPLPRECARIHLEHLTATHLLPTDVYPRIPVRQYPSVQPEIHREFPVPRDPSGQGTQNEIGDKNPALCDPSSAYTVSETLRRLHGRRGPSLEESESQTHFRMSSLHHLVTSARCTPQHDASPCKSRIHVPASMGK